MANSKSEKRQRYVPDVYQSNIGNINYIKLKEAGVKLLSFDIEGTLVGKDVSVPSEKIISLFKELKKEGFKCILLSDNMEMAKQFMDVLGVPCAITIIGTDVIDLQRILERYASEGIKKNQMAHIGNELKEDVFNGNKLGIITCLVRKAYSGGKKGKLKSTEKELIKKLEKHGDFYRHHKYEKGDQYYQYGECPGYCTSYEAYQKAYCGTP